MKAKVAYQTEYFESGIVEIEFEWPDWMDGPLEEAIPVQMMIVIREKTREKAKPKGSITESVVLGGDVKEWLQSKHKDHLSEI